MPERVERAAGQGQKPEKPDWNEQFRSFADTVEQRLSKGQLDRQDMVRVVGRVFEHSIEDGLDLAQRLRLTPKEIREACYTQEFTRKHEDVADHLDEIGNNQAQDTYEPLLSDPLPLAGTPKSARAQTLLYEADALFAPLLAARKLNLVGQEAADYHQEVDLMAENFLSKVERAFEKSYYTGPIKDLLRELHILEEGDEISSLHQPTITSKELQKLWGHVLPFDELERRLKHARFLLPATVIQAEQKAVEKALRETLESSLEPKGKELFLNEETNAYEIRERRQQPEKRESKKPEYLSEKEIVDAFREALERGADPQHIASNMGGLDSEDAWNLRDLLYHSRSYRVDADSLMQGLSGLDSSKSYSVRNKLINQITDPVFLSMSLIGLTSPEAQRLRNRLKVKDTGAYQSSLLGLDTEEAWHERETWLQHKKGDLLAESLTGLDNAQAWQIREMLLDEYPESVLLGLAGIDSPRAWQIRRANTDKYPLPVLESLAGLDSDRVWELREKIKPTLDDPYGKQILLDSIVGLASQRARELRLGADLNARILSFNGSPELAYAWRLAKKRSEPSRTLGEVLREKLGEDFLREQGIPVRPPAVEGQKTSMHEEIRLRLLNAVHHPTPETVQRRPPVFTPDLTKRAGKRLGQAISDAPEAFLHTMPAKRDRSPRLLAERLFERMYPEAARKESVGLTTRIASFFGFGERPSPPDPSAHIEPRSQTTLEGGGETLFGDQRKVVEFRDTVPGLLVTGLYGDCDASTGTWKTAEFPLSAALGEPVRETTAVLEARTSQTRVILPRPLDANVLADRVKGVSGKEEMPLETTIDHLGNAVAHLPPGVKQVLYSIEYSRAPSPMLDLSEQELQRFISQFERAYGKGMRAKLADLPEDVAMHVRSPEFRRLAPKERVIEIERMVRLLGYYDKDNEQTVGDKRGKSIQEKITLAELRAIELRNRGTAGTEEKRFAGVCADYAAITCVLLREAGFPAGVVKGLKPEGKTAMARDSHASAYVVWPSADGSNRIVLVDGTPASDDPRFAYAAGPTLGERERAAEEKAGQAVADAERELVKIADVVKSQDEAAIRKLTNGRLERALNVILHYEIREPHTAMLKEMMDVYWYGGLKDMERLRSDVELRKVMEDYLDTRRLPVAKETSKRERPGAGTELFGLVQDFLRKYKKATGEKDASGALDALERIGALANKALEAPERRALNVIVTYLRAKQIGK